MDPILLKILVAAVVAFVISAVIGKFLVPALRRWKAGQSIKEDGPTWHMSKQGTPTMGGLMFILATIIVVLVFNGPAILSGDWTSVIVLVFALVFGAIGFLDDYAKIKKKENTGLTAGQKFLLQLAAAILFIVLLRKCGILSPNLYVPFFGVELHLPWVVYLIFAVLVITGTVNAVNITDGLDGLSSSVTLPVCAFFAAAFGWAWVKWQQSGTAGMAVFAAALFGGLVGFLVYNHYPAKVFMGDTGSLFLGGAVCGMAFALDLPHAADPDPRGDHLHRGDPLRHHPGDLLQGHPRQAHLPHGPPPPPPGDGGLEREKGGIRLRQHLAGVLHPGLLRGHGALPRSVSFLRA